MNDNKALFSYIITDNIKYQRLKPNEPWAVNLFFN